MCNAAQQIAINFEDRYMWSERWVVIVGFRLWGISKIYKIYTNIYKIYTKYQAAAAAGNPL